MKISLFSSFVSRRILSICVALTITVITSCKKEFLSPKMPDTNISQTRIQGVHFRDFQKDINIKQLGPLREAFSPVGKSNTMAQVSNLETNQPLNIVIDNIIKLVKDGHIIYNFPIALTSPMARNFQNLTIDQSESGIKATLITYFPDSVWMSEFKQKKETPFRGKVKFEILDLSNLKGITVKKSPDKISSCESFDVYDYTTYYSCGCPGQHYLGDPTCNCPIRHLIMLTLTGH